MEINFRVQTDNGDQSILTHHDSLTFAAYPIEIPMAISLQRGEHNRHHPSAIMTEYCSSSDDDLPRIEKLISLGITKTDLCQRPEAKVADKRNKSKQLASTSSTRKVRRLGDTALAASNPLLLPWNHDGEDSSVLQVASSTDSPIGQDKAPKFANPVPSNGRDVDTMERRKPSHESHAAVSPDAMLVEPEDPSLYQTAAENISDFNDESGSEFAADESTSGESRGDLQSRRRQGRERRSASRHGSAGKNASQRAVQRVTTQHASAHEEKSTDLNSLFGKLRIHFEDASSSDADNSLQRSEDTFTPLQQSRPKGLVSPRKLTRIPQTSLRSSADAFWSQDFVDDWNDEHSPRKQKSWRPNTTKSPEKSPTKTKKKVFDAKKRSVADDFLRELDAEITHGKIAELAESTGGVKLVWTKTLNTTAGRANWRRETIRSKPKPGIPDIITHHHHASIELAEKVIDDEDKLLNVLAHEFCHLANFMVSGITNNPHGKDFKAWAAKCSRAFGDSRGIKVTTKHTYEIDFKYRWACMDCGSEYKRHSKSIDPRRHRCGSCQGLLAQTKPVPRQGAGAAGGGSGKRSEYQVFVKEQMNIVKGENPGSPQKEVMRIVAGRWAQAKNSLAKADKARTNTDPSVADEAGTVHGGSLKN
ncbi:hypothetical protein L249_1677 [Ophiocordyceps polyrhachis-furcata BCC 54312]|uniref:SprT-like domain-containing protein n=1 Tax=Ophiocordyceps polyrhachis-furcata BCC 54312 TaxID=1330021 RepID=A0A367KZM5_9HYPO|nr:hypothetical protein L249_1677 [Ophiocordyceps polyrhachis-furcata BCC 54312]